MTPLDHVLFVPFLKWVTSSSRRWSGYSKARHRSENQGFRPGSCCARKSRLAFSVLLVVCFGVWGAYIWKSHKGTSPIVAVVRFDNETGVPDVSRLRSEEHTSELQS